MPEDTRPHEVWTEEEVEKAVETYFTMFNREMEGEDYTKADYQRKVADLKNRSKAAVRSKFGQISKVLEEEGYQYLDGYTPRAHYQNLLREHLTEYLDENPDLKVKLRRPQTVEQEVQRRHEMWEAALERGGPEGVEPTLIRKLNIYRGQAGIWRDKERTAELMENGNGVTVSVLHTGESYEDDLSEGGMIYDYPETDRLGNRDENEVEATKNASRLEIPIFVVVYGEEDRSKRDIYLGRVVDWNDETEEFLILFDKDGYALSETVGEVQNQEQKPFHLTSERSDKSYPQPARPEQPQFRFNVFKRYGKKCAVCEIDVGEMLGAAHIRGKAENGSDDPRNGLVLCKNHHAAFDEGLFSIEPETHLIHTREEGPSENELRIKHSRLNPARNEPHEEAVQWHWEQWKEE